MKQRLRATPAPLKLKISSLNGIKIYSNKSSYGKTDSFVRLVKGGGEAHWEGERFQTGTYHLHDEPIIKFVVLPRCLDHYW